MADNNGTPAAWSTALVGQNSAQPAAPWSAALTSDSSSSGRSSWSSALAGDTTAPSSPVNGQTPSVPKPVTNPDEPWYSKSWDFANTPLLSASTFGLPEDLGMGGAGRGIEHIVSGLTSPLSLALTAATFGTGGFLTSAGETALKEATLAGGEAAFSAADIAQIAKGSEAALKAYRDIPSVSPVIREALEAGGHDLGLLQKAREAIGPVDHDIELGSPEIQSHLAHAGFNPEQLEALAKTGDTIKGAVEGFKPVEDAVREAGVDPDLWKRGQSFLHDNGMDEASLLGGDAIDRGAFQVLHHIAPDLSLGTTLKAARTAKTLMETGFTLQQLEGAAAMSPRFFDALKEGDYDHAAEYGTEWAANAFLGVAGASHALHAWGELAEPILGAKLKPSDEQLRVNNLNGVREAEHAVGDQQGLDVHDGINKRLGHEPPRPVVGDTKEVIAKKLDERGILQLMNEVGNDPEKAAAYRETLARAEGGTPEPRPLTGLPAGQPIAPAEVPSQAGTEVVFSNKQGEVRVGADGRPVVWMSPEAWSEFEDSVGHKISGVNYSQAEAEQLISRMKTGHPTGELFKAAQDASKQSTLAAVRPNAGIQVVGEELHHTWQRELSQDSDIRNHLDPVQWVKLGRTIPQGQTEYLRSLGYAADPVTRVAETAAKFRAGIIPEGVTPEEAIKWLSEYENEVKAKHGPDSYEPAERINEVARQHLEDINAAREARNNPANQRAGQRIVGGSQERAGSVQEVVPEEQGGVRGQTPEGLKAREVEEEPFSFVSPNVYKIGNVSEAETRLGSRPQKIAEKLSADLSTRLGIKAVVRPSIGHWEGGAENSMISRFAPGTDPEAIEYHNAIMGKVNRQNAGISFIPDAKGPDQAYQFRVPSSVADPKVIARLLEEHGISGSSIEPVAGGHNVIITSPGGELRGAVSELANRLKATQVEEHNGRQTTLGDWNDRDAAGTVYDARIRELEAKHPEWSKVRSEIESSPAYNTLSKLIREAEDKVKTDENARPFLTGVHGSRTANITELNPEFAGKGPQGGAEAARARNFPDDFVKRSYLRLEGSKNEPFYERLPYQYRAVLNSENLYNWAEDRDGLLAKAEKEAAVRKMDTHPGAVGTIYERMMKDSGYDGYYHPGANQIGVFKNTPVAGSIAKGELGLFSRENPTWNDVKKHLTDEEIEKHNTPEKKESLLAAFKSMPTRDEWVAATKAGKAGQMWYERSSRAFDALLDSGIDSFKPVDKDRFLNFTAALSPVQPVRQNLLMAIDLWSKWDKAGRPTDVEWSDSGTANKSAKLYKMIKRGVDLPARLNNAVRALQGEPLSGPKVSSFTKNLGEDTSRVTNDTWMAVFGNTDPNRIGKPATYDAMSAHIREAAKAEKIEPRQAQAAVWSFVKTLAELSGWGNDRWIPPQEIIKQGLLTPDLIAAHSADFADLLSNDKEIRDKIQKIGGNLAQLDENIKSYAPARPVSGAIEGSTEHLLGAADRLEAARNNNRTQAHLERKQEGGLFDQNTAFRPENGLFSKEPEQENVAPTWYLKSNQLVDSRMQGPMPADTALKMLENNGVKPDELKYTGLSDFLKEKGKEPVRPEELREYLKANNLQIKEVTKGGGNMYEDFEEPRATKFESYVLPGAEPKSYRELLMTLPSGGEDMSHRFTEIANEMDTPGLSPERYAELHQERMQLGNKMISGQVPDNTFKSAHWDEPNVVGHVRFNDRTGLSGEKLLHLEELQSDWHQNGRKEGYKGSVQPLTELPNEYKLVSRSGNTWEVVDSQDHHVGAGFTEAEATRMALKRINRGLVNEENEKVPDAPFKKTWPEFLFKRMVRYAAENGYDGISWTPGEEQAARYNLSKQISEVHYSGTNLKAYNHSGDTVLDQTGVSPNDLPDIIGKEASQKLMAQEPKGTLRSLVGQDLKVGGEGMKGFYDKIVPDLANKLGKQFGAKVGETKIPAGQGKFNEYVGPEKTLADLRAVDGDKNFGSTLRGQLSGVMDDMKKGRSFTEAMNENGSISLAEYLGGDMKIPTVSKSVPHFPITDSLRESVLKQGQPLFSKDRPVNGLPDNLEEMLQDNKFKDQPEDYRKNVINWFDRIAKGDIPENVNEAYKYMRQVEDRNWEIAHANALIKEYTENHIHRYFDDNPEGKLVVADAKSGKFATNVTAAQHRTYDTLMTALLKDPRQLTFDPAKATSLDRAEIVKASANRKFISQLMSSGLRASDGRPVAFLNGAGNVVAGENGKDPKTFVDPNRVRKINIDDKTVAHLTQTGDLQRFVDDGTIKDITPYIHPDNMGAAIDRLETEANRKVDNAKYDEQGNNVLLEKVRQLKQMQESKDFSGLNEMNEQQPKVYAWSPQGYVALDHNAMRGWNFVTNSPDGNQVLVNSDVMVHPEYAEYLKNRLGLEKGALSKSPVGKAILSAGKAAKETLLSLSPFHLVQIGLRGIMTGVNPFTLEGPDIENGAKIDPSDPNSPTKIKKMVEQGYTTGRDYKSMQEYTEGLASGEHSLLRRVPIVGPILADSMQFQSDFLFKRFLPAIKATAAEKLFDDYQAKYPEWSTDKIARAAASHANDSFGGVNWKAMGRNATTQEWARAVLLAPDWLEAELRSGARLFNKDEGAIGRRQVIIMAGSVYLMARVLNAVTTGNPHYEAPFSLATKSKDGKETLWGIRMLPSDLLSAASSPSSFIKGRLSPGVGLATEALTGRDKMGRKMQPQDLWADATRQLLPIPVQSIGQAITNTGPEVGNVGQAWKAAGGTARTYASPAQTLAVTLASTHNPDGFVDPVQQAHHRAVMELGDRLRSGEVAWPDLVKMTYGTSQLKESDLKNIQNNYKATQGLPADIAHLYSRASRLPAKEFLDVWDTANITEQKALQPLLVQAQKKYIRKAAKDLTPEERQADPTFQRLLKMAMGTPTTQ